MNYALLIYDSSEAWNSLSEEEQETIIGEYFALAQAPGIVGGSEFQPVETATTVRVANGETVRTDRPFPETKEFLGGYYLVEADRLETAIELAARVPAARMGGAVEVRPLVEREPAAPEARADDGGRSDDGAMATDGSMAPRVVVERFLDANDVLDVDGMFEEIGDEAVWSFPAAPAGAPREMAGKQANREFFESLLPMWKTFRLPHREVHALEDDSARVVAYYSSDASLVDGSEYRNTYLSLVTVRDGKIVHWIEFCDPGPLERGVATMLGRPEN